MIDTTNLSMYKSFTLINFSLFDNVIFTPTVATLNGVATITNWYAHFTNSTTYDSGSNYSTITDVF